MPNKVIHRLVGYDPMTERLVWKSDIPERDLQYAKEVAGISPGDPEALGSYPLKPMVARDLGRALGLLVPPEELEFFLEPFSVPHRRDGSGKATRKHGGLA